MAKQSVDAMVLKLLSQVKRKRDDIERAKKTPKWRTNCSIGLDPESVKRENIQVIQKIDTVVSLYVMLMQEEGHRALAASELEVPLNPDYMGYPIKDWKSDLKSRAAQLTLKQKQKDLETLEARVNKLVSPDQRREMELEALQQELAD